MVALPKQFVELGSVKEPDEKAWLKNHKERKKPKRRKPEKTGKNAYDPNSATSKRLRSNTSSKLPPSAKRRRERFVRRYIIHFNQKRAAMEIGISEKTASKAASEFLREPYTLEVLDRLIRESEEADLCTRNEVIMGLKREANYYGDDGQSSARVSAWGKLGKYLGMEKDMGDGKASVHLHFDAQDDEA